MDPRGFQELVWVPGRTWEGAAARERGHRQLRSSLRCRAVAPAPRARAAFTLVEMLFVVLIIGTMLGFGFGVFASLDLGERAAAGLVQNVVRAARNSALARGAGARVRIDPSTSGISAEALEVIGTWRFEEGGEEIQGAFDLRGPLVGCRHVDDGFIGRALGFPPGERIFAEVGVQRDPAYHFGEGFRIECAVRLAPSGGGRVLRLGESIGIDVTDSGSVRAWFVPEVLDTTGSPSKGGRLVSPTPPGTLRSGEWRRIAVEYDRRRFTVAIDGRVIEPEDGFVEETAPVYPILGPLVLGDVQQAFAGDLDDLVISTVTASDSIRLPEGVLFDPGSAGEIRFDAGGNLDRAVHPDARDIRLVYQDGRTATVRVGLYGTVE